MIFIKDLESVPILEICVKRTNQRIEKSFAKNLK